MQAARWLGTRDWKLEMQAGRSLDARDWKLEMQAARCERLRPSLARRALICGEDADWFYARLENADGFTVAPRKQGSRVLSSPCGTRCSSSSLPGTHVPGYLLSSPYWDYREGDVHSLMVAA